MLIEEELKEKFKKLLLRSDPDNSLQLLFYKFELFIILLKIINTNEKIKDIASHYEYYIIWSFYKLVLLDIRKLITDSDKNGRHDVISLMSILNELENFAKNKNEIEFECEIKCDKRKIKEITENIIKIVNKTIAHNDSKSENIEMPKVEDVIDSFQQLGEIIKKYINKILKESHLSLYPIIEGNGINVQYAFCVPWLKPTYTENGKSAKIKKVDNIDDNIDDNLIMITLDDNSKSKFFIKIKNTEKNLLKEGDIVFVFNSYNYDDPNSPYIIFIPNKEQWYWAEFIDLDGRPRKMSWDFFTYDKLSRILEKNSDLVH